MKNLYFFLFISSALLISCSEDEIVNDNIDKIVDEGSNIIDGKSSNIIKKSSSIFGQWMFNTYSGGGGGNKYGSSLFIYRSIS